MLALHTLEVIDLMFATKKTLNLNSVTDDIIFLAGLYHDYGKCWDYLKNETWCATDHKHKINHGVRGAIQWNIAIEKYGDFYRDVSDEITHAILAHHGTRENGAPVSPCTELAWLLHLCDGLSGRLNDFKKPL